jgi:hypothetical protein
MKVDPIFVLKDDLQRHVPNVVQLRSGTVQRDLDAHTRILVELVFKAIATDLHLLQSHDCLIIEAIVFGFDFATMFDGLILRLHARGLKQKHSTAAQNKQDLFHIASPKLDSCCDGGEESGRTREDGSQAT